LEWAASPLQSYHRSCVHTLIRTTHILLLLGLLFGGSLAVRAERDNMQSAAQPSHQVYLPLIATPSTATSADPIDAARKRGEIDTETALVYKVFAAFDDQRLPAQYRGDDSRAFEAPVMGDVSAGWAALKPATRALLAPFFQPPLYRESWYGQRRHGAVPGMIAANDPGPDPIPDGNWRTISALGGKLKVGDVTLPFAALPSAGYVLSEAIAGERMIASAFVASIPNRRLFGQATSMQFAFAPSNNH
jgi:hypothetical protein